jgi:hypothetical protein
MERRGFSPFIINIKRLAERLISRHGGHRPTPPIGKCWVYRFITRHPAIKQRLICNQDSQRLRQERYSVMQPWFQRVKEIIEQYRIIDRDITYI